MKTIGITGGVGAGKSEILRYIQSNYNCMIIMADNVAHELESPGHECYDEIVKLLGSEILDKDGFIQKNIMAGIIFSDDNLKKQVNDIIHPAVKTYIKKRIETENLKNKIDYLFVEAALLIEEGYEYILDELWYIRADEDIRRQRLRANRNYSDEKISAIFAAQLSDDEYSKHSKVIIDNSKSLEDAYIQIDNALM